MNIDISLQVGTNIYPHFLQSLTVLSMDSWSLYEYIKTVAEENPFIEVSYSENSFIKPLNKNIHQKNEWDFLNQKESCNSSSYTEHLEKQIPYFKLPRKEERILLFLIGLLDHNGYLTMSCEEISKKTKWTLDIIKKLIHILHNMEPYGTGAMNAAEALVIQAQHLKEKPSCLIQIIENHLGLVAKRQYKKLSQILRISVEEVVYTCSFLKKLNPKPSNGFYNNTAAAYIVPDVKVNCTEKLTTIEPFYSGNFKLEVVKDYDDYFHSSAQLEAIKYIHEKRNQANALISSVQKRETTILKCIELLTYYQKAFFSGKQEYINPLKLLDISSGLNLSQSTVCRALKGKYLYFENKVYPINFFFSPVSYKNMQNISQNQIVHFIIDAIQSENKLNPLSDEAILLMLQDKNINISRRTIAKYRSKYNIPNASQRKSFAVYA